MTNETPAPQTTSPAEKPSLWQRIKTGTKNFVSHALGYLPRGIVLTALVFAVSAVLEGATGLSLLGVSGASKTALLGNFAAHLAAGCVISGVIGAALPPCNPCAQSAGEAQASSNPLITEREKQHGEYLAKLLGEQATHAAQAWLHQAQACPHICLPRRQKQPLMD